MSYPERMRGLRREWGGRCVECGAPRHLEFAHLPGKPTGLSGRGRGMPNRYHDVRRNPESYVLLCRACHMRLDGRRWRW